VIRIGAVPGARAERNILGVGDWTGNSRFSMSVHFEGKIGLRRAGPESDVAKQASLVGDRRPTRWIALPRPSIVHWEGEVGRMGSGRNEREPRPRFHIAALGCGGPLPDGEGARGRFNLRPDGKETGWPGRAGRSVRDGLPPPGSNLEIPSNSARRSGDDGYLSKSAARPLGQCRANTMPGSDLAGRRGRSMGPSFHIAKRRTLAANFAGRPPGRLDSRQLRKSFCYK